MIRRVGNYAPYFLSIHQSAQSSQFFTNFSQKRALLYTRSIKSAFKWLIYCTLTSSYSRNSRLYVRCRWKRTDRKNSWGKDGEKANRLFSLIVLTSACLGILMTVAGFILMSRITALLGAVLLLPVRFSVDGVWYSVVFAELMAAVAGGIFIAVLSRKYHY